MKHSLERKITVGHAIGLVMLCFVGMLSLWQLHRYERDGKWSDHTREVIASVSELSATFKDAEAGARGFVISGDDRFLEPFADAVARISPVTQRIASLTADNPGQQQRLGRLSLTGSERLAVLQKTVDLRKTDGFAAAQKQVMSGQGRLLMNEVAGVLNEMRDEENRLLKQRTSEESSSARATMVVVVLGLVLAVVLATLSRYAVRREIRRRDEAEREMRQARAAADSANHSKSEFLANMSHEIRTPLTAIVGYADLLLDPERSDSERLNNVNIIRRNAEHLLALISGVLDLSKIEAGEMTIESIACSPCQIVADVASTMRVRAVEKGLNLEVKIHGPIPRTIRSDPTRLRQVLINLMGNAVKFTPSGRVQLSLRMAEGTPRPQLRFDVVDTGVGMAPEQAQRIFQPFVQADSSTTRRFGGSGLGLSISRKLARMLGGEIEVSSAVDQGSRFTLTIDTGGLDGVEMLPDCTEAINSTHQPSAGPILQLRGRILLAEDGSDNRQLLARYLQRSGAEVETAENGSIAVEMVEEAQREGLPFQVVFMDMQMPILDGYAATAKLRGKGYSMPIVALTAHAMAQDREKCLRSGCTDYLTKPASRAALLEMAAKHLNCCGSPGSNPPAQTLAPVSLDDPDLLEFLPTFIESLPTQVSRLAGLLAQEDMAGVKELLHALKGSGGLYGFPQITGRASAAERAVGGGDLDAIKRHVSGMIDLIRTVQGYKPEKEVAHELDSDRR